MEKDYQLGLPNQAVNIGLTIELARLNCCVLILHNYVHRLHVYLEQVFSMYQLSMYAGQVEDILVGTLPNFQHGIGGQLYLRDTKTLVIENFSYDGLGVGTWAA